ncbi:MAG: methylenetetrahydrofolate--tRNA-(uracil(54)-C(5))-methyltransferase (FADH(2)-oxidizing) TrmFO [Bacillota bacterium]|nr:MAG: methylenetetrahydrofolate--tRNA-(uracil(54)-C(5))-methyltransferase (FADH(2)-oxidizing) TrmFO [Bacillota bacterium]
MNRKVDVIGGGLAGTEAALYLAKRGVKVVLHDIKPKAKTPAHHSEKYAELVCSNSLKSNDYEGNACGLLKEELRALGSSVIAAADKCRVPAGNALAVDRERFSELLTEEIKNEKNIETVCGEVTSLRFDDVVIAATGPLTTPALEREIQKLTGEHLFFFDAASPIVSAESIDMEHAFYGDRYNKGNGDHINCPMDKETYEAFVNALLTAEKAEQKSFENTAVFEGCMPVEVMAARGMDTLRFGTLKPVGLYDPRTNKRGYACLQLRREDEEGTMFNLVGFQTNLKWGEQKRVFSMIPALKNAEYLRYGVMHRNTFIDSPKVLGRDFALKSDKKLFFAGQLTGVEGYVESVASGMIAAINALCLFAGKESADFTRSTVMGALSHYIATAEDFQPMNANYGILAPLDGIYRDKTLKRKEYARRSLEIIGNIKKEYQL